MNSKIEFRKKFYSTTPFKSKNIEDSPIGDEYNKLYFKQCFCKEILIIDDEPFNLNAFYNQFSRQKLKIQKVFTNYILILID